MPAPPFLLQGAEFVVIKGDSGQPGPFTIRLQFPAGYKIPPHKHPAYQHITVLSGTYYTGERKHLDPSKGKALQVSSFA